MASDEGSWRGILECLSPAVQLDLTTTHKHTHNVASYAYFGEWVTRVKCTSARLGFAWNVSDRRHWCIKWYCVYRARVTLIKVPRGNEFFAGFSAGAVRVFTEKYLTGSKALRSVGFSPFFARHASVEVRYRSTLLSNLNANFRSFWIHFTVTPVVWVRSFIPMLLNSNNGNQDPVLQ